MGFCQSVGKLNVSEESACLFSVENLDIFPKAHRLVSCAVPHDNIFGLSHLLIIMVAANI